MCCGSAGVYKVVHPAMAGSPLENKMRCAEATGTDVITTANPGCLLQLRAGAARAAKPRRVLHVVELLDEAYRAAKAP